MVEAALFLEESENLFKKLYQISFGLLRNHADSEDAVQQGLMKAWAAKARANPDTFRPWLTRIVINECRNIQRHRMRVSPKDEILTGQYDDPLFSDVMDAVKNLPDKYQMVFTMKYIAGFSEKETAAALHLPLSTVKNRLAKARLLMRESLSLKEVTF